MFKYLFITSIFISTLFFACSDDKNPLPSKTHPESWMQQTSENFHGKKVATVGYSSCTSCHGADLSGGEAKTACITCHVTFPHVEEWIVQTSEDFHGNYIRQHNWSMENCQSCHGTDYKGAGTITSCYTCHKSGGPESCNTCHGSSTSIAPPEDTNNNILTTAIGVGAHQLHLALTTINCETCHSTPTYFSDAGHIDSSPNAEVNAALSWDHDNATCTTECHTDPAKSYIWNIF